MDQATHNKSFNRNFFKPQSLRTLAEYPVLLSHRLLLDKLPAGRDFSSKQIVVTLSQELAARLGARFNGHAPTRRARLSSGCHLRVGTCKAVVPPTAVIFS